MTAKTSPMAYVLPGLAALALLSALPSAANATACGEGRILMLQLASGESSEVRVVTSTTPSNHSLLFATNGQWTTQIWHDNLTRWNDRLRVLRTAFALGQTVQITSNDPNCMGPSEEFTISVKNP